MTHREMTAGRRDGAPRTGAVQHEPGSTVRGWEDDSEKGAATVEFILVFPFALALIALVLFAGWLAMNVVILEHGTREGARALSLPTQGNLRTYPDDAYLSSVVDAATPLITPTAVTSDAGGAARFRNAPFQVTVTYEVTNPVGVLLGPLELLGFDNPAPGTLTITSTSKGRFE